ncbi:choice-of-anchor A family protein [Thiothrix nivea]|nr:choice-of-anchor A family protein [Thiothrix nivea]
MTAICLGFAVAQPGLLSAASLPTGFGTCEGQYCPASYQSPQNCGLNGADSGYSVFVGGNLTSNAAELEGLGLIGGNLTLNSQYNVGQVGVGSCTTAPWGGDQLQVGGSINDVSKVRLPNTGGGYRQNGAGIPNFTTYVSEAISGLTSISSCLGGFDETADSQVYRGTLLSQWGQVTLDCDSGIKTNGMCPAGIYLFDQATDIDVGYISSLDASVFPSDGSATLIINMTGVSATVRVQSANSTPTHVISRYLLWNFPNATTVNIEGSSQFDGMVLAPKANVTVNASGMNGRFVAGGDVVHNPGGSEFHNYDFIGSIPDSCLAPMPAPPSVEIGNRVWADLDADGIQDAGEPGIDGVDVTLSCSVYPYLDSTTTTSGGGEYYFSNAMGGTNVPSMAFGKACTVSIADGQAALTGYSLTQQNAGGDSSNDPATDLHDSDAAESNGKASISFTVGNAGEDNHGLDFGFTGEICSLNPPTIVSSCNDNGTSSDPSDDTFSYTINLTGSNAGTSYNIGGGDVHSGVTYDIDQGPFGNFPISGGDISLTLTDFDEVACTLADVAVAAPATCSDQAPPRTPLPLVSASCSATDSDLSTSSYVYGHQIDGSHKDKAALVSFAYTDVNDPLTPLATAAQIGTTWGLAHHESGNTLYAAALMKRHAGFGPGGPGAIYQVHAGTDGELGTTDDALGTLVTLNAGTDPHPATAAGDWFHDAASFDAVGKLGLGDIDLAADGSALYAINLYDRKLYSIPLSGATPPVAGSPTSTALPVPGDCPLDPATPSGEMNLNVRPFAVKVNGDRLYVGMTCTAQSTGNAADLRAYVYEYDGTDFLQVLNVPLNYTRGTDTGMNLDWRAWTDDFTQITPLPADNSYRVRPQPWLADLEFDGGDLILGFRDRTGDQLGRFAGSTDTNDNGTYTALAFGDILRACGNPDGYWTLEANGSCGSASSSGVGNGIGPNNGEFYVGDQGIHINSSSGALALLGGSGEVVTTQMDAAQAVTSGVRWLSNSDGQALRGKTVALGGITNEGFGKGNGLGDLEILCATPVQVDIELTKTADKTSVKRGDTVVYTLTASNTSTTNATGVQVTDVLPAGVTLTSPPEQASQASQGTYNRTTGVWDIGNLDAGQPPVTLTITVTVD